MVLAIIVVLSMLAGAGVGIAIGWLLLMLIDP